MSGRVLLNEGRRRPPRRPRVWAWVVLVVSVALAPFFVMGAIESWARAELFAALLMTFVSVMLVGAVLAALVRLVSSTSAKP